MNLTNCTRTTEFILVGLPRVWGMERVMYASVFLLYILCLLGNGLIIMMVILDHHLQKPMYFFLSNLSFKDIGHTTTFMPKLLFNYLSANNSICFYCCLIQLCFYFLFGVTEFFIITLISLDRYLAICHPLRHSTIMTSGICLKLSISAWFGGFFSIICQVVMIANLPYCSSNIINHFFCDVGPMLKIAGGDSHFIEVLGFLLVVVLIMSSLLFTLISYFFILCTILQMPSTSRQQKAFSTCASHLVVVSILYGSVFFVYLRPTVKNASFSKMKSVSILYTMITPVLNPFIYTIRNNEVQDSVRRMLGRKIPGF
ncbi:olfactory receptor 6X1-like [Crotalus tigris]|uniref:olfactory receptor 6X1-like n=1 Tax=Crotalus tigris TaxID=88082 RepID=UPI00192FA86C|nr:olfactory receptor 6X1-like [Crotalus tigris]XP_039185964.1 olfactory receptor 6X1-like [Crotalus tigris]